MLRLKLQAILVSVLFAGMTLAGCNLGPITPPPLNQSPTANAGADQTVEVSERVELNGLGSTDPDDDPLTYIWEQRFGPNVTLNDPNSPRASFLPVEDGFYEFALTVTDGRGGSDTSAVRVFVGEVDPSTCPRADAGVDQTVNEGSAVTLRGGNSADPSGNPLSYEWFQLSGPQVSINGVFAAEPLFAAPQATGADIDLEFELTVTNEQGCSDRDTVVITVRDRDPSDPCHGVLCEDDGLFCNGVESCNGGLCVSSGNPCLPAETCDEHNDACVACLIANDCDDGLFCTGVETCVDGACVSSGDPCGVNEMCDEATETCETEPECTVDADCDDALFCTGVETCVDGACLEGTNPCVAGQTCDEHNVESYAEIALPGAVSFDPQGNLFAGSGAAGIDPSWVYKVPPGGIPETYGAELIPDPDSVIVDATGIVSERGSVLVGGLGSVYAISSTPPHLVVVVLSGLTNINELAFDSTGRLLMLDQDVGVYWSTGDQPELLFSDTSNTMAIDPNDLIYTGGLDGVIRVHDADGNLIDGAFATGLGQYPPVEVGRGGTWGTDVYSIDSNSGELLRISASGSQTVVSAGFSPGDLEFGPDDALYLSDFGNDRILRIAPACSGPINKSIAVCCENSCGPCAPSGACMDSSCAVQLCAPRYTTTVQTGTVLQLEFSAPDPCASIRLNIYVDGAHVHTTGWLGWPGAPPPFNVYPLSTGLITLSVSSGTHQLELEAEGQPGGCNNVGEVCSWGGTLTIQPAIAPQ